MIRLITTDIDGTLIEDGCNDLNPEYYNTIRRLREKGILFAAASGRQYDSILSIFEPVKEEIIFIAENGAHITHLDHSQTVSIIQRESLHELIRVMRTIKGCEIFLSGKNSAYVETKDESFIDLLINGYKNKVTVVEDLLEVEEDGIKISLYCADGIEQMAAPMMIPKWTEQFQVVVAGHLWLDIMNLDVNKGTAIMQIQESYQIDKSETMSFGDNLNDLEMLSRAKYSYAIGNAREEVKEAANYIADTNTNDGVLKILKSLL